MKDKSTKEYSEIMRHNGYIEVADRIDELLSKVEEMKKTLEWYADKNNWWMDAKGFVDLSIAENDSGERARQALKGDPK